MFPLLALAAAMHSAEKAEMFPFQLLWDDASESATNISWLNDKPAGRDGFVHVKDGHLFAGEKRLRIFGVNTCFAANFPDKAIHAQLFRKVGCRAENQCQRRPDS